MPAQAQDAVLNLTEGNDVVGHNGWIVGRACPTLASGHLEPRSDVNGDFDRVEVDEVADLVVRDAPKLGPGA